MRCNVRENPTAVTVLDVHFYAYYQIGAAHNRTLISIGVCRFYCFYDMILDVLMAVDMQNTCVKSC